MTRQIGLGRHQLSRRLRRPGRAPLTGLVELAGPVIGGRLLQLFRGEGDGWFDGCDRGWAAALAGRRRTPGERHRRAREQKGAAGNKLDCHSS